MTDEELLKSIPEKYTAILNLKFVQRKGNCYECWFNREACTKLMQSEDVIPCPEGYCWRMMKNGVDLVERNIAKEDN